MRLRRLGWAGIELESQGERVVVDLLVDPGIFAGFMGEPRDELIEPEPGVRAALLTHLHRDHADVGTIRRVLAQDGVVLRPEPAEITELDEVPLGEAEAALGGGDLAVRTAKPGDSVELGPFTATAVDAVDGLGSPQVSWVVRADGEAVLHGGDTLWHGRWWHIARQQGPIHVACLPANGVQLDYPQYQPAVDEPAALTPEQAVKAARALGAGALCPIHYNATFDREPFYRPVDDPEGRLAAASEKYEVPVAMLRPGEWTEVSAVAAAVAS
ncbi:MAG TPA: MBL fold metallo-hydrolase [Solirubrobacteraceae bacterium]|jgi:L-ascorbate metabolism protein UlaG (beta-lactamase superfamily)|nr:MBL fold metallo-hydrolase [Solirubrobacteraceae bacterium]